MMRCEGGSEREEEEIEKKNEGKEDRSVCSDRI